MQIIVDVKSFYDWHPVSKDEVDKGTPHSVDPAGKAMKRVHVKQPSYTTVMIPPLQIQSTYDNFAADPVPFSRLKKELTPTRLRDYPESLEGVLAWHLFEKVMPGQAPIEDWGKIHVEKDPKLEKLLNKILQGDEKQ